MHLMMNVIVLDDGINTLAYGKIKLLTPLNIPFVMKSNEKNKKVMKRFFSNVSI